MQTSGPTPKSGAIIIKNDSILLLYRARQNDWSFPKGHVEVGESDNQTMIREIKEETRLDVRVIRTLPDNVYTTGKGESVNVAMFLAEPIDPNQETVAEHDGDRLEWVSLDDVPNRLSYENLKEYFQKITHELC